VAGANRQIGDDALEVLGKVADGRLALREFLTEVVDLAGEAGDQRADRLRLRAFPQPLLPLQQCIDAVDERLLLRRTESEMFAHPSGDLALRGRERTARSWRLFVGQSPVCSAATIRVASTGILSHGMEVIQSLARMTPGARIA
jgi:hypothetical protein